MSEKHVPEPRVDPLLIGKWDGYAPVTWWEVLIYGILLSGIIGLIIYAVVVS